MTKLIFTKHDSNLEPRRVRLQRVIFTWFRQIPATVNWLEFWCSSFFPSFPESFSPVGHEVAGLRLVPSDSRRRASQPRPIRDHPGQRARQPDPAGAAHDAGPSVSPPAGGRHELPPAAVPAEHPAVPAYPGPRQSADSAHHWWTSIADREGAQPGGGV